MLNDAQSRGTFRILTSALDRLEVCYSLVFACGRSAREKASWIARLEAEEIERLSSVLAALNRLRANETPLLGQLKGLLVAAFQGQVTLMRASRVFPDPYSESCMNVADAMDHGPTSALASWLHQCCRPLGLTRSTLKAILRQALYTAGTDTWLARRRLYVDVGPPREGESKALEAFTTEGSGGSRVDVREGWEAAASSSLCPRLLGSLWRAPDPNDVFFFIRNARQACMPRVGDSWVAWRWRLDYPGALRGQPWRDIIYDCWLTRVAERPTYVVYDGFLRGVQLHGC